MTPNSEPITRKKLTEEVKFICYMGVLLVGVVGSYFMQNQKIALIEQDLGYIKTNHLVHMEADIDEMRQSLHNIELVLAQIDFINLEQ